MAHSEYINTLLTKYQDEKLHFECCVNDIKRKETEKHVHVFCVKHVTYDANDDDDSNDTEYLFSNVRHIVTYCVTIKMVMIKKRDYVFAFFFPLSAP